VSSCILKTYDDPLARLTPRNEPGGASAGALEKWGLCMGFMDKARNAAEKLMGQGKEAAGQQTNDPNMEADGQKDQVVGDLKNTGEKARDTLND
jgi:uncharacterized protein YjbJ (UPF0337 family)